jgi:hypothetical protein
MDPPLINYIDHSSILVINSTGKMRQLYVPFRVQCIVDVSKIPQNTWVYVEEVMPHEKHIIIYRILDLWVPYNCFKISVW